MNLNITYLSKNIFDFDIFEV